MYPTWTDDPVGDYMRYDAWRSSEEQETELCSECGEPIEGDEDYLDGLPVCKWCMARHERESEEEMAWPQEEDNQLHFEEADDNDT